VSRNYYTTLRCDVPGCKHWLGINNASGICKTCSASYRCSVCDEYDPYRERGPVCEKCKEEQKLVNRIRRELGLNEEDLADCGAERERRIERYAERAEREEPLFAESV
jgi:hypothetical protein